MSEVTDKGFESDGSELFRIVGRINEPEIAPIKRKFGIKGLPVISIVILAGILFACIFCELIAVKDPAYLDLANCSVAPDDEFWFGTDTLGRDIFSMVWYGGRVSLFIGLISAFISAVIAIIVGAVSGFASDRLDLFLMRITEIFLSVPSLLIIVLFQAIIGEINILSITVVIGITNWMGIAKVVRAEVRRIKNSEYVIASEIMGGGFFHILRKHLMPNFFPAIMFMLVMNICSAITMESTLSFMGIGLPIEVISWGSMLSLSEKVFLTGSWWIIVIPGLFLIITLVCFTNIGNYVRRNASHRHSNL
ncbi:MAG: ABC transporter permease [Firmicutes bacterium]|nr:ABC transporter permease [Bacillota bacterium]